MWSNIISNSVKFGITLIYSWNIDNSLRIEYFKLEALLHTDENSKELDHSRNALIEMQAVVRKSVL